MTTENGGAFTLYVPGIAAARFELCGGHIAHSRRDRHGLCCNTAEARTARNTIWYGGNTPSHILLRIERRT